MCCRSTLVTQGRETQVATPAGCVGGRRRRSVGLGNVQVTCQGTCPGGRCRAWASRTVGRVWNPRGSGKESFCIFSSTLSCTIGSDATRVPPWMPKAQGHLNSGPGSCFSHPARLSEGGKVCTPPAPKECHPLPGLLANLHQSWLPRQQWTQRPWPRLCQESTWKVVTDT